MLFLRPTERTFTAYHLSSPPLSHLCTKRTTDVAPFPIAKRSHTPYFFDRLTTLSPALDRRSPSESDFLLLAVERAEEVDGLDGMRLCLIALDVPYVELVREGLLEPADGGGEEGRDLVRVAHACDGGEDGEGGVCCRVEAAGVRQRSVTLVRGVTSYKRSGGVRTAHLICPYRARISCRNS